MSYELCYHHVAGYPLSSFFGLQELSRYCLSEDVATRYHNFWLAIAIPLEPNIIICFPHKTQNTVYRPIIAIFGLQYSSNCCHPRTMQFLSGLARNFTLLAAGRHFRPIFSFLKQHFSNITMMSSMMSLLDIIVLLTAYYRCHPIVL